MDEKEIRKILKEETVIPDNIDKAMEDVLKGILDSPDERMSSTKNLIVKSDKGRSKNSGNKKKIIRILLPVAAVLGLSLIHILPCGVRLGPRGKGSMRKNLTKRRKRHERYFNETAFRGRCSFRTSDKKMEP